MIAMNHLASQLPCFIFYFLFSVSSLEVLVALLHLKASDFVTYLMWIPHAKCVFSDLKIVLYSY